MNYVNYDKVNFIFKFSNNFFIIFFTYIKMPRNSSAKYFQENKERLKKGSGKMARCFQRIIEKKGTIWS